MKTKYILTLSANLIATFYFIVSCSATDTIENNLSKNKILNNDEETVQNNPTNSNDSTNTNYPNYTTLKYLALGDSYTVGASVDRKESYPYQLSKKLEKEISTNVDLKIIATSGWRTDDLLSAMSNDNTTPPYDLVTLLIGVNNQFQGTPFSKYQNEFPELLAKALKLADNNNKHVVVISIPDYAYTPFGSELNREKISGEIDKYNTFAKTIATQHTIKFVNITDITRQGLTETNLVANDGLHPSGIAYKKFMERLSPIILSQLKD